MRSCLPPWRAWSTKPRRLRKQNFQILALTQVADLSVNSAAEDWPADAIEVGRVTGSWGIKGGIKVKAFASEPQALFSSKRWFLQPPSKATSLPTPMKAAQPFPAVLQVTEVREQGDGIVATTQEIKDRDAAKALLGAGIFVSRSNFPAPEAGEFYWIDLIGLAVVNRQGDDLGQVLTLVETGPHCVLSLSTEVEAGQPRMIPFVEAYVDKVDSQARLITVDWPSDF